MKGKGYIGTFLIVALFVMCMGEGGESGKITNLPGLKTTANFDQYSGYIVLNATTSKSMFYWLVESQNNPTTDPLIVWLQGGPGCSSLLGLFTEHGPFYIIDGGELVENEYSWNKKANVLYVESPVGVGFSYSNSENDYHTSDNITASDNYSFLNLWLEEFPEYEDRAMWIAGESYAGVYVPMLVNLILTGSNQQMKNNLQGFTLGNPVLSCPELKLHSLDVQINLYYYHGLIPLSSLKSWYSSQCDKVETVACGELFLQAQSLIKVLDDDNLYTNFCTGNGTLDAFAEVPSCLTFSDLLTQYLNRKDVQEAIFAKPQVWTECYNPKLHYKEEAQNMLNYYNQFFVEAPNLKILIYSGDIDISTVPHAFTQLCVESLSRPLLQPWTRWTIEGKALEPAKRNVTAGYVEVFDRFTFATVKGAGHEVPTYQPFVAYNLYDRFIISGSLDLS